MTFSDPTNVTSMTELALWLNGATNDLFWTVMIFVIFFIAFISLKVNFPTGRALAAASFLTAIPAILFRVMGLTSDFITFIFIILTAISIVMLLSTQSYE